MDERKSSGPLENLTIVEHGQGVAASYAGRLFGVMGASVIKLEPPGGAELRHAEPMLPGNPPRSALFEYLNVNKHSVTCDLGSPEGCDQFKSLLRKADLLIDDTPVQTRTDLGLDPDALSESHPDLIFLSLLPYGSFGEDANKRAYEINAFHSGGEGYLMPNGLARELFPDRPPLKVYGHFAELIGGTSAIIGAIAALIARPTAGGQFVDVATQDANVGLSAFNIQRYGDGVLENRDERSFKYGGVMACTDGYVQLLTLEAHQWQGLVHLVGDPAWAVIPEFDDPMERGRRGPEINKRLRAWFETQTVEDVVRRGQELSVPICKYNTPEDLLTGAQMVAREVFQPIHLPGVGDTRMQTAPFKFSSGALHITQAAPPAGADAEAVMYASSRNAAPSPKRHVANTGEAPLAGMRVADFTLHAAGPFAAHMLSLLGAEVIKIESSLRPDIFRRPHPVYGRLDVATFDQVAANKLSLTLNLKHPEGAAIAKRLVAISDVVAESFRPGVMDRLGLDYESLKAVKPDIVMVSVSASGQDGPERGYAGYAPLFGAAGGLGTLTGYTDGPPIEIRHVMDHSTGLTAAAGVIAALYCQRISGQGQHVDVAAREVASSLIGDAMMLYAATGREPHRCGNADPDMAPHGVYRAKGDDNWVAIAVRTEQEWRALADTMDGVDGINNPRFLTRSARQQHAEILDRLIEGWTRERDANQVTELLQAAGVAASPSLNAQQIVDSPHLRARGTIVDLERSNGERRAVTGPLWQFSKTRASICRWTPELGEHNAYVLGNLLGLDTEEIKRLVDNGVVT